MTARQCLEAILMELSKVLAPSLKLYEFNYYINKAINLYVNKIYNIYDINLLTTDDLRVLKTSAFLTPKKVGIGATVNGNSTVASELSTKYPGIASLYGATYEVYLPLDYIHMLNCICIYKVNKLKDCFDAGSYILVEATRLTADAWSQVINDLYNRPTPMHPYYYIHNNNQQLNLPTNPIKDENVGTGLDLVGNDISKKYSVTSTDDNTGSNFKRTYKLNNTENSLVEKNIATRISNPLNIRCEIRYGRDDTVFQLEEVWVDYIKSPLFIRITLELIDLTEDTSQIMEFPDYVNLEIINEAVKLIMERTNDPRLANNALISQSIARPTQQLQQ